MTLNEGVLLILLAFTSAWGWWCWFRWGKAIERERAAIKRNQQYISAVGRQIDRMQVKDES